jgi:hypothetical protein
MEKPCKSTNYLMRPNQEVYRRVEKKEIMKLCKTSMKSSFIRIGYFRLTKCLGLDLEPAHQCVETCWSFIGLSYIES